MLNSGVSVKIKSLIESENTKILVNQNFDLLFLSNFHGVVVRALGCSSRGSWFESHCKWFEIFLCIFQNGFY